SNAGLTKERPVLTCEHCGKRFSPRFPHLRPRFCSIGCKSAAQWAARRAAKPERHCQQCGARLTKRDQKTFCSRECANEFRFHKPNGSACEPVAAE
ncbi:MAG: hypothetical protein WAM17_09825, partial [Rhodoplanes sp.]